jgi:hypothetical protein
MGEPDQQTSGYTKEVYIQCRTQLCEVRNKEINGETPDKSEVIRRQNMIDKVLHIQSTHIDLPLAARQLISRDQISYDL